VRSLFTERTAGRSSILRAQFYGKNRVIDGPDDGFMAEITS
jgi:hypothetical protein